MASVPVVPGHDPEIRIEVKSEDRDLDRLDKRIDATKDNIEDLGREIARTDDAAKRADLEKAFGSEQRTLAKLARVRKAIAGVGEEAKEVHKELTAGQIKTAVGGGLLTRDEGVARLVAQGFAPKDAGLLLGGVNQLGRGGRGMFGAALGSPLLAAGIGAGVVFSPFLGAATAGLLTGGLGLGAAGAGIASAAMQDADVRGGFKTVGAQFGAMFREMGEPFREPLKHVAVQWRRSVEGMRADWVKAVGGMARHVEPLARGFAGFVEKAGPGLRKMLDAAGPVMTMIAAKLPGLGEDFATFAESIASAGPGAAKGMGALFDGLGDLVVGAGEAVEALSRTYDNLDRFNQKIKPVVEAIVPFADALNLTPDDHTIAYIRGLGDEMDDMASATDLATARLRDWDKAMGEAFGEQMDLDEAAIAYKRTLLELTGAVKDHGTDLRETTKIGLENRSMILGWIQDAEQWRDAQIAMGDGSKAAIETANAAYQTHLAQIRTTLVNLGFQKKAIDDILAAYQKLSQLPNITKLVTVRQVSQNIQGGAGRGIVGFFSGGGPVPGDGPRGVDSSLIAAAPGEYVLNTKMVDQLGGLDTLERVRRGGGTYMSMPSGGVSRGGASPASVSIHYAGGGSGLDNVFLTWLHEAVRTGRIQLKAGGQRVTT